MAVSLVDKDSHTCNEVVRKGGRKPATPSVSTPKPVTQRSRQKEKVALLRKRVPQTLAVIVDCAIGEGVTLTYMMKTVARNVELKALGITVQNTRVTRTASILLEVDSSEIANTLAEKMRLAVAIKCTFDDFSA